jgi:hypothetical protein
VVVVHRFDCIQKVDVILVGAVDHVTIMTGKWIYAQRKRAGILIKEKSTKVIKVSQVSRKA